MKITYNTSTKTQTTDKSDRWIQKTSNNYAYLYGVASGWLVKATFTRRDGVKIGNVGGVYDTDPDGTYCYVIQVPTQAAELDKQASLAILIYEPSGDDYIIHGTIDTAGYFYPNSGVVVPEDLSTEQYNALNISISNLGTNKHEHSAIVGTDSETVDKDTPVYSKLKSNETFETIADADAHKNRVDNPHSVTKAQVGLGNVDNTSDTDKPVSSAQQAALNSKANLAGGNTFSGQQNITGPVNITNTINTNGNKINFVGNPVDGGDAVNKNTLDSELTNHDDSESSHEPIRLLIQELGREISRLDGRGVSYGEIPYTTAELQAMDSTTLLNAIIAAVEAQAWFSGTYSPTNGDLVYDTGVGDGVNYHEWEYNQDAGAWADNGAISSPKATNDIYGAVKGNSYVSIVAGLMQVLLADNATYLKDAGSSNKYTYQQIYDAITNRYTKAETDALFDALKAVYGWESTVLTETPLTNLQQLSTTEMQNYDMVIFEVRDSTNGKIFTQTLTKAHIINGARLDFFNSVDVYVFIGTTTTTFYENANYALMVTGIKMDGTVHNEMRSVGAETITYRDDGKVSQVVADAVTTTPTYDAQGNITKITEVYALDSKTYETTFTYDKFGRISATNKVEV